MTTGARRRADLVAGLFEAERHRWIDALHWDMAATLPVARGVTGQRPRRRPDRPRRGGPRGGLDLLPAAEPAAADRRPRRGVGRGHAAAARRRAESARGGHGERDAVLRVPGVARASKVRWRGAASTSASTSTCARPCRRSAPAVVDRRAVADQLRPWTEERWRRHGAADGARLCRRAGRALVRAEGQARGVGALSRATDQDARVRRRSCRRRACRCSTPPTIGCAAWC